MHALAIILLCVGVAVGYGVVHDQVTARICVEYFTIGHAPIFGTTDPTLLGLGWGVLATWWAGLLLGIPLALVARAGRRPKRTLASLLRPVGMLLAVMAATALLAGFTGWVLARLGVVVLLGRMAMAVPPERHVAFLAVLWAHNASYLTGFGGGLVVICRVWRSRHPSRRAPLPSPGDRSPA